MLRRLLIAVVFMAICSSGVFAQIVFEYEECDCDNTIYPESRIKGEKKGVVIVYSEVNDLRFEMYNAKSERLLDVKHKEGKYILILEPMEESFRKAYGKYDILIKATGFQEKHIYVKNVNPGSMCSFCCILRSPTESPKEKLARITVYDKDYKLLVGAEVKNKTTGYIYGTTRSDGTIAVGFDKKGEITSVIVSHPSYSDTKEITVEAGVHDYKVYLRNYNPPKKPETPRPRKLKPEKHTTEISVIGGTSLGLAMDFTWSYFLIGFGVDWLLLAPEQTTTSTLVNSGYTGNFTKTTTMNLNGNRTNVFLDMGAYFKYFSISCQVGLLCGTTIDRTSLYDGWGYGLKDGDDLDEYWGTYEQRTFTNTTSVEELHLTFTPQIKGYIPVGSKKATSIAIGLGYTFIPSLDYNPGMSGSFGVHFRF